METCYELETFKVRLAISEPCELGKTRGSGEAWKILRAIYADLDADQEHFSVLLLDNKNRIRRHKVLFTGSQTTSLVHPAVVFRAVVLNGACAIILAHNHPSGDPAPSPDDVEITRRLIECGELFGIRTLDHIILGEEKYFSCSDRGLMSEDGLAGYERKLRRDAAEKALVKKGKESGLDQVLNGLKSRKHAIQVSDSKHGAVLMRAWKKDIQDRLSAVLRRSSDPESLFLLHGEIENHAVER